MHHMEYMMEENLSDVVGGKLKALAFTGRDQHQASALCNTRIQVQDDSSFCYTSPDSLYWMARDLINNTLSINFYKRLQAALCENTRNIDAFLRVQGVLPALVRDLHSQNQYIQQYAASCFCNITRGNFHSCLMVAKHVGAQLLLPWESLNGNLLLQDCIAWTIGNLVIGTKETFPILHAQGFLQYIIMLLHNCNEKVLHSVTYAAAHYVHAGLGQIKELEMIEVAKMVDLKTPSYDYPDYIWLLAFLSSTPACLPYINFTLCTMVDYLYENSGNNFMAASKITIFTTNGINNPTVVSEITATLRVLSNMVCEPSGSVAAFLFDKPFSGSNLETLFNVLLSHEYTDIRTEALWLITNLYNHERPDVHRYTRNMLPKLQNLKQVIESYNIELMLNSMNM